MSPKSWSHLWATAMPARIPGVQAVLRGRGWGHRGQGQVGDWRERQQGESAGAHRPPLGNTSAPRLTLHSAQLWSPLKNAPCPHPPPLPPIRAARGYLGSISLSPGVGLGKYSTGSYCAMAGAVGDTPLQYADRPAGGRAGGQAGRQAGRRGGCKRHCKCEKGCSWQAAKCGSVGSPGDVLVQPMHPSIHPTVTLPTPTVPAVDVLHAVPLAQVLHHRLEVLLAPLLEEEDDEDAEQGHVRPGGGSCALLVRLRAPSWGPIHSPFCCSQPRPSPWPLLPPPPLTERMSSAVA